MSNKYHKDLQFSFQVTAVLYDFVSAKAACPVIELTVIAAIIVSVWLLPCHCLFFQAL